MFDTFDKGGRRDQSFARGGLGMSIDSTLLAAPIN